MNTKVSSQATIKISSKAARERHSLLLETVDRLAHMAHNAIYLKNLRTDQFVMVCIKVDSYWWYIVDVLMPNHDLHWQSIWDRGEAPIARGSASFQICKHLSEVLPNIAEVLLEVPDEGRVKVIILDDGGATVYEIEPKIEGKSP